MKPLNPRLFAVAAFVPLILMDMIGGGGCSCGKNNYELQFAPAWYRTVPSEPGVAFYDTAYGDLRYPSDNERPAAFESTRTTARRFSRLENALRDGGIKSLFYHLIADSKLDGEKQAAAMAIFYDAEPLGIVDGILKEFPATLAEKATVAAEQERRYSTPRIAYHVLVRVDFDVVASELFHRLAHATTPEFAAVITGKEAGLADFKNHLADWQKSTFGHVPPPPADANAVVPPAENAAALASNGE